MRYITERGVDVFDCTGNSADLTPIEEVWNFMKKNLLNFQTIRKKLGITFVTSGMELIEKLVRNCMMQCMQWWKLCVENGSIIY